MSDCVVLNPNIFQEIIQREPQLASKVPRWEDYKLGESSIKLANRLTIYSPKRIQAFVELIDAVTQLVDVAWEELSPTARKEFESIAYKLIDLDNKPTRDWRKTLEFQLSFAWASINFGKNFFSLYESTFSRLVDTLLKRIVTEPPNNLADDVLATVYLKSDETVKVRLGDVEAYLAENRDKTEPRRRQRRGPSRGSLAD